MFYRGNYFHASYKNYYKLFFCVLYSMKKRDFYFSGPFELKQGGLGIVGRMPIFIKEKYC